MTDHEHDGVQLSEAARARMQAVAAMRCAPWYPPQRGDLLYVHRYGETYGVVDGDAGLRLTFCSTVELGPTVGRFAPGRPDDPLLEPWLSFGPDGLTLVRDGVVIHPDPLAEGASPRTLRDAIGDALIAEGGVPGTLPAVVQGQAGVLAGAVMAALDEHAPERCARCGR